MLSLSPERRRRLQDAVQDVLRESLADGGPRYHSLAKPNDQTATAFAAAVWSAVEVVVDDFLDRLSRCDPLVHLPVELVSACFRLLGHRDRIAVSHVSRAWRHAALTDCGLWTTMKFRSKHCAPEMLEAWLLRSGNLPFDFAYSSFRGVPEPLLGVITRNLYRMRLLELSGHAWEPMLQASAPCLQHLRLGKAALPATWGALVPRLQTLALDRLSIPDDFQALPALTSLKARLAEGSSAPVLSRAFPRLAKLELAGVTQDIVAGLGAPPPSCKSVTLSCLGETPIDYSPFLEACYESDTRLHHLSITDAGSIVASIREFTRSSRGKCTLNIGRDCNLRIDGDRDRVAREIHTTSDTPFIRDARSFVYLDRLDELVIPLNMLVGIHELQLPGATFPALRALTLGLILSEDDITAARNLLSAGSAGPRAPLRMPRLRELSLDAHDIYYQRKADPGEGMRWILSELPGLLPALVETGRPCLEVVQVVLSSKSEVKHFRARQDLAALRDLAKEFRAIDQDAFYNFGEGQRGGENDGVADEEDEEDEEDEDEEDGEDENDEEDARGRRVQNAERPRRYVPRPERILF